MKELFNSLNSSLIDFDAIVPGSFSAASINCDGSIFYYPDCNFKLCAEHLNVFRTFEADYNICVSFELCRGIADLPSLGNLPRETLLLSSGTSQIEAMFNGFSGEVYKSIFRKGLPKGTDYKEVFLLTDSMRLFVVLKNNCLLDSVFGVLEMLKMYSAIILKHKNIVESYAEELSIISQKFDTYTYGSDKYNLI